MFDRSPTEVGNDGMLQGSAFPVNNRRLPQARLLAAIIQRTLHSDSGLVMDCFFFFSIASSNFRFGKITKIPHSCVPVPAHILLLTKMCFIANSRAGIWWDFKKVTERHLTYMAFDSFHITAWSKLRHLQIPNNYQNPSKTYFTPVQSILSLCSTFKSTDRHIYLHKRQLKGKLKMRGNRE